MRSAHKTAGVSARARETKRAGQSRVVARRSDRRRLRILVTAGPTREYIDPVRFISNESSGRMGVAAAAAALRRGHAVTLVHGPMEVKPPREARCIPVVSAADMLVACRAEFDAHDVLIMAAAVADYRPAHAARAKLKKSANSLRIELLPTVDILRAIALKRRPDQIAIGFALEDGDLRKRAEGKLAHKCLDAIILNSPAALSGEHSRIEILVRGRQWLDLGQAPKTRHAAAIIQIAENLAAGPSDPPRRRIPRKRARAPDRS